MATTVDQLIVEIKADTKDLQSQLRRMEGRIGSAGKTGSTAFVPMIGSLKSMLPIIAGVVAGLGAIGAVRGIAQVGSEFEDMRDSLNQVFGSMQGGERAFNNILTFAQTTPFQVEDVTRAFISLKGAGIEPSADMLQVFADTASTSVDQLGAFQAMVRLVQRSAAGGLGLEEINQLDDRGIPATKILTEALGVNRLELSKFGQTAEDAAFMVEKLIEGMKERFGGAMEQKMDNLSTKTSNMTIAFKELQNSIFEGGLGDFLGDLADKMNNLASAAAKSIRAMTGNETAMDIFGTFDAGEISRRGPELIKEIDEKLSTIFRRGGGSQEAARLEKLRNTIDFMVIDADEILFDQLLKETADASDELTPKLNIMKEAFGSLDQITKEGAQSISEDFTDALLNGENVLSSFADFTKSIISQIIATFLRLAVIEPILQGAFSALGLNFGTPTGSAATGGLATHNRPMLVGERGPELFVPHTPGSIINSNNTRSALAGGGSGVVINQSINFATGVVPTVRKEVLNLLPQISQVTKASVLEASARGGSFSRTIRGR